nr:uncharacterized protein LOC127340237 [Lolium perenne]
MAATGYCPGLRRTSPPATLRWPKAGGAATKRPAASSHPFPPCALGRGGGQGAHGGHPGGRGGGNGARGRGQGRGGGNGGGNAHGNGGRGNAHGNGGRGQGRGGGNNNGAPRPVCQICNKVGHIALRCYSRFDHAYGGEEEHSTNHAAAYQVDTNWYMDSRATDHITGDLDRLHIRDGYNGTDRVQVGNGAGSGVEENAASRQV